MDLLFLLVLALFFSLVIFALKASVQLILTVNTPTEAIRQNKDVRIDFQAYEASVKLVEQNQVYVATSSPLASPFKQPVKPTP